MRKLTCMIDLHLHLDGAISMESARQLAKLQDIPIPETDEALNALLTVSPDCKDLNEFLEKFAFPCSLLQTREGLENAAFNLCTELIAQGVMYAEIRFAPQKSCDRKLTQREAIEAVLAGVKRSGLPCGLILCCMRDADNQAENRETVELCGEYLGKGVCALDLAGAEALFPTADFADLFAEAGRRGIPFTIHAGEADGPKSVQCALDLGAARIGHGVRAAEDESLMERLAAAKTPLELCPTSNLNTAIYSDLSGFPLRKFMERGILVTVNTDDPSIEGTTIAREYELLIRQFGLSGDEVRQLLRNSVEASFAPEALKEKMREQIEAEFAE
ncbi:MAG: adenosine deaminase [Lachnospiraceae bacterium]|nr:adenosine deaminase [Lachnospiraceae bacterium]